MGEAAGLRLASRGRERSVWLSALAAAGAVIAVVAAKLGGAPQWLQVLMAAAGAVLGLAVVEWRARRAQEDKIETAIRMHVVGARADLPRIGEVTPADVGVHPAIEDVAYVRRNAEAQVKTALRERGRVLIVGPSMSGKTRTALQVVMALFAEHQLLKPAGGTALHQLLALGLRPHRLVVWLDDLERFVGADGLAADDLAAFCADGTVAVASIRSSAYEGLLPRKVKPAGWETINWFGDPVWLRWKDEELERSADALSPELIEAARRYELPAYLGGGLVALGQYRAGEAECPVGHALVRAAADWRRLGVPSAVPRDVLVSALPGYLGSLPGVPAADDAAVMQGLDWATERLNHTVSLLEKTGDGYEVLDYIVDHVAKEDQAVPDTMWERLLARAPQSALVNVGFAADTRHGRRDRAEAFWENSGHRVGWYNLGLVHYERGDEESMRKAERWWRLAAEGGDPGAAYGLVVLLQRRGDEESLREAERWSRRAAEATGGRGLAKPSKPVLSSQAVIRFSGVLSDQQKRSLTATLRGYMARLESLGFALGEVPTIHVEPETYIAYPEPAHNRLFIGAYVAHDAPSVLHEYSHWELERATGVTRDSWTRDVQAIEAGLAYYLPCSALNTPRTGRFDLTNTAHIPDYIARYFDDSHLTGLRWAGAFWEMRESLGWESLDESLAIAWEAADPAAEDRAGFADRLCGLVSGGPPTREIVRAALVGHDVLES